MKEALAPGNLEKVLRGQRAFDWLKIDVDGADCVLLSALLRHGVQAKGVIMEVEQRVPPPFVVSNFHHVLWAGCSLSAQVQLLRIYDFRLYKFFGSDAIYLHESVNPDAPDGKDEFLCYRQFQRPWRDDLGRVIPYVYDWMYERSVEDSLPLVQSNFSLDGRFFFYNMTHDHSDPNAQQFENPNGPIYVGLSLPDFDSFDG